ncbi:MAG: PTS system mannose/fructose/sorbose family transporter subunit IID [Gemmatimonadota bacterium]
MMDQPRPGAGERRRVALRSTLLQAVWNYETLQAVGFAWALLPGLERLYPDSRIRRERVLAHLELFNSNPYLAPIAMGVVLRLEREVARGVAGAEGRVRRLVGALRGTLGALGDDLFWAGWRPALGAAAASAVLVSGSWWPVLGYWLAYNGLTQAIRIQGVAAGYTSGAGIARVLQDPFWRRAAEATRLGGAVVSGAALALGAAAGLTGGGWPEAGLFFVSVALLGLAARPVGSGGRRFSPALAFLALVILLSVLYQASAGMLP